MKLAPTSVRGIMLAVSVALLPGIALQAWQFGPAVWLQTGWCTLFALLLEALCLRLRQLPVRQGLSDFSWLVCGLLLGQALPLMVPAWMMLVAALVALGLTKHASGGLGQNRLNPVMAGLGVIAVCFYQQLYPAPSAQLPWTQGLSIQQVLAQQWLLEPRLQLDSLSGATPLAHDQLADASPYVAWIGYLAGGLLLVLLRVIRLEIPLAMAASSVLLCILAGHPPLEALYSLTLGGFIFAAFFIATDPVTSPDSRFGRILFGAAIGAITELVREFGLYADGLCFAVLAGNLLVTQLDALSRRLFQPWYRVKMN
ncbi:RnfABCDGE type electron transport complex subunit D [Marinobacterium arenosum]|uniref:RnfABCDGE type electron transport complex subunit D n=1 Tax=Marinobacterium arenosum TaxID=2862496 RepID=UPI001C981B43|nr:RnfABCDGE type electron transport complex subunit D [Marinobacterium arenosum]MBY4678320.1 RnfABCDGE type electron transport complex subunit D [Marinobacterium arenosum]